VHLLHDPFHLDRVLQSKLALRERLQDVTTHYVTLFALMFFYRRARSIKQNPENKKLLTHLGSFTLTSIIITAGEMTFTFFFFYFCSLFVMCYATGIGSKAGNTSYFALQQDAFESEVGLETTSYRYRATFPY
jgi:hypothetical protein